MGYSGFGGIQSPDILGYMVSQAALEFLTPLMMCWGGIRTTTRRLTSSFGPQVLMPSMGDRSVGSENNY